MVLLAVLLALLSVRSASAATFTVNSIGDGSDVAPGNGVCQTSTAGECTLRAAILEANAFAGTDTINFNIPPGGVQTITPLTALPTVSQPAVINGTTQPGFVGSPIIEISGAIAGPTGANGLHITAGNSTVRGLVINRFSTFTRAGIFLQSGGGNLIQGNYLGTDVTGTIALGNNRGMVIHAGNNTIGGTTVAARNLVSGNIQHGITIEDNFVGTCIGIGNGNTVQGNFIGTDKTGMLPLPNNFTGVEGGCANTTIGGTTGTTPGGPCTGACNVISAINGVGITVGRLGGHIVQGNYLGTDVSGTLPLGNQVGVFVGSASASIQIGGSTPAERNVISANLLYGVEIQNQTGPGHRVQGNYIGTDTTGTLPMGNRIYGIFLAFARDNLIGGTGPGEGNVISANLFGMSIEQNATRNLVQGNLIGTQEDGTSPLGNTLDGVIIHEGAVGVTVTSNTVGGTASAAGNTIAFNGQNGVAVGSGNQLGVLSNAVLGNSIHSNVNLGINLRRDGVTPNDPGDADAGPNNLQNFPVLTSASTSGSSTTVNGTLNSTPNTNFRIEFFSNTACDSSLHGEGETFLGFRSVTTNAAGNAAFTATVGAAPAGQQVITSTATDPANNTSEFSQCVTAGAGGPATLTLAPKTDTNTVGTPHTVTATARDLGGNPVSGVTVRFSVSGANSASGSDVTDANGEATFTYTGTAAGTDTISAFADTDNDGMQDAGEPRDTATKIWTPGAPARLVLTPPADTNVVGETHCVTATVTDAFGNPVPGVTVRFSVPTATATAASPSSGSATTDANGQATFCYSAALPGQDAIHAYADTDNDSMQDAGEPFGDATKTWTPPPSTEFCEVRITEGGWIVALNGDQASFGGNARVLADGSVQGQQEYQDHGPAQPRNVHSIELTAATCSEDRTMATIFGTAAVDGAGMFVFRIDVSDQGEPGTNDTYGIILSDGYVSGQQQLQGGNVQIH